MPIRVNTRELLEILAHTPPAQNVLLVGRHGIGKSEIIAGFYAAVGRIVNSFDIELEPGYESLTPRDESA